MLQDTCSHTATTPTISVASKACFPRKPVLMEIPSLIRLRYADVIQLLDQTPVFDWLGEDHRTNTIRSRV